MLKLKKAEVEWLDSSSNHRWGEVEEYIELSGPSLCRSIGYVLVNDERRVVLAQSHSAFQHVADTIAIPREVVRKFRWIRDGLKS